MADDLARNQVVAYAGLYTNAGSCHVPANLREPERGAFEVWRLDCLRNKADIPPAGLQPRATRIGSTRLKHDAREPQSGRVAVPHELLPGRQSVLAEVD